MYIQVYYTYMYCVSVYLYMYMCISVENMCNIYDTRVKAFWNIGNGSVRQEMVHGLQQVHSYIRVQIFTYGAFGLQQVLIYIHIQIYVQNRVFWCTLRI